ncbi:exosporium glycoprotein BclB-related protein [Paenibacillus sp. D2_2]|uniref:exosporium glycoprotein BclB-related protein n=1 Tax=Paenibacillus sp. D2_2 TaxID=3073092 RepID=UPI002815430F|nr:exosporium glycoprotein BclB-related protein [Paenibacillus sp. D2_2]WMT43341.1 exosporium glycoprotein BclB-related protein [Paenibacillus sp. D2_2]
MATTALGLVGTGGLVGFGSSIDGISALGGIIDLSGTLIEFPILDFAFSVPRAGTITSIAAFFSTTIALTLEATVTVTAQLYTSTAASGPTNTFIPIPGASVDLSPSITGIVAFGTVLNGITTGLSVSVSPQDRLLMVFTVSGTDITVITVVTGYASAGITIN